MGEACEPCQFKCKLALGLPGMANLSPVVVWVPSREGEATIMWVSSASGTSGVHYFGHSADTSWGLAAYCSCCKPLNCLPANPSAAMALH